MCIEHIHHHPLTDSYEVRHPFGNLPHTQEAIHFDSAWWITNGERSRQRTGSQRNSGLIFHHPLKGNPFTYSDYRRRAKRGFNPAINHRRLGAISTSITSTFSQHCLEALTLLIGYPVLILTSIPGPIMVLFAISLLPMIESAGEDDDVRIKLQPFDGVAANFTSWLISFSAWVAWKKPEIMALLNGKESRPPDPDSTNASTAVERKKFKTWSLYNTQLYGAIVTHVTSPIQASLHVNATGDGVNALEYLKKRYGSQSTGDTEQKPLFGYRSHI